MPDRAITGEHVKRLREELGLSQADLAALAGVTQQRVNAIEHSADLRPATAAHIRAVLRSAKRRNNSQAWQTTVTEAREWAANVVAFNNDYGPESFNNHLKTKGLPTLSTTKFDSLRRVIHAVARKHVKRHLSNINDLIE